LWPLVSFMWKVMPWAMSPVLVSVLSLQCVIVSPIVRRACALLRARCALYSFAVSY